MSCKTILMHDLNSLLDLTYEAAFFPERWPIVLHALATSIGAEGTILFSTREDRSRWIASPGVEDIMNDFLDGGWDKRNTRAAGLVQKAPTGFVSDFDVFTEQEMN